MIRPLKQIEDEWLEGNEEAQRDYEREKEEYELCVAAWKEEFKKHAKHKATAPDRPTDKPEPPKQRRLIVNDPTPEKLHEIMKDNPAGVVLLRDELTGWLSTLDRPGREGERAFHLEAWNGDGSHTVDRIGRGTLHAEICESLLGGIQPGRLRSYLVDALEDGPANDGLIQRFQVLVWPDTEPGWTYVDRAPDSALEDEVTAVFRKLVELDPENPITLRFAPDAQELFVDWLTDLEAKVRGDELHPALASHLSKYRSLMPALALLFQLAEWATRGGSPDTVSLENTQRAAAYCEYLESHARRMYSCVVNPQLRAARELADKIKKRKVGSEDGFFAVRDVYLKGWSGLDTPDAVRMAAEILEDANWIRDASPKPGPLGGRPPDRYQVNPRIWE